MFTSRRAYYNWGVQRTDPNIISDTPHNVQLTPRATAAPPPKPLVPCLDTKHERTRWQKGYESDMKNKPLWTRAKNSRWSPSIRCDGITITDGGSAWRCLIWIYKKNDNPKSWWTTYVSFRAAAGGDKKMTQPFVIPIHETSSIYIYLVRAPPPNDNEATDVYVCHPVCTIGGDNGHFISARGAFLLFLVSLPIPIRRRRRIWATLFINAAASWSWLWNTEGFWFSDQNSILSFLSFLVYWTYPKWS